MEKQIGIPDERIRDKIFLIRDKKIMFDKDLAELYGVETRTLNQAVKRNLKRFPEDFMFQLTREEMRNWQNIYSRSQIVILEKGKNIKYLPYVFTEQGIAMLSSILKTDTAIEVNIQIIRTFTKLREIMITNNELRRKIEDLERKYDKNFKIIFDTIKLFLKQEKEPNEKIGFDISKAK